MYSYGWLLKVKRYLHNKHKWDTCSHFYPTYCVDIVFNHSARMDGQVGGWVAAISLSGLNLRNCKVQEVDIL